MFRIAPVVLFAAALCTVATAQAAIKGLKEESTEKPAANGAVKSEPIEEPIAEGTVLEDGTVVGEPSDEPKPIGSADLKMWAKGPMVEAFVHSSEPGFVGIVGLSLSPDLIHSFGLPPLLMGAVVMAYGATNTQDLGLRAPISFLPYEPITLYGQALVIDEKGLWSSNVVGFLLGGEYDANEPVDGSPAGAAAH